ncbi:MAG: outer membrane beta-barrel protein, partial [Azospirillaceae bacterium]
MYLSRLLLCGAATLTLALPSLAAAQDDVLGLEFDGNWYIQGGGGLNWALDQDLEACVGATCASGPGFSYDLGWLAGGAVGYEFNNGFRTEFEGTYRSNDLETAIDPAPNVAVIGLMFNLLYDIDTGSDLTPYLGGGIGAGNVDYDGVQDEWGLALQAIAGLSWALAPEWELFTQYHYFTVLDSGLSASFNFADAPITLELEDYAAHSLFFGARYHFLPPPPPPPPPAVEPPPPPPPPAQDRFIVFFDWDRS